MKNFSLLAAAAVVLFSAAPAFANHKASHQNPPGFEDKARDHANTVNSNAGAGNGGEACCNLPYTDSENHLVGGDTDPGNSEGVNQAGKE